MLPLQKKIMVSFLNVFRFVAFFEGVSYILLLFIATPIKYLFEEPKYVKLLGMPHGLLFIMYIIIAYMFKSEANWSKNQFGSVLLASIIPFGTFYIDRKYLNSIN